MQELTTFEVPIAEPNDFATRGTQQPAPNIDILISLLERLSANRNAKYSEALGEKNQELGE